MATATIEQKISGGTEEVSGEIDRVVERVRSGHEIFEEICGRCPFKCYSDGNINLLRCPLFKKLGRTKLALKLVLENKALELYKWNRSMDECKVNGQGYNHGWAASELEWIGKGYAAAFADVFEAVIGNLLESEVPLVVNFVDIYKQTVKYQKEIAEKKERDALRGVFC